ncbi:MAG: hypothetical protein NC308_03405 [Clostridium sp.]|nr:hypothetical protein [Bacteroides sp.]MCM1197913.1 hypothetical protein [Clostridium sp.]
MQRKSAASLLRIPGIWNRALLLLEGDDENNDYESDSVSVQPEEQVEEENEEQNDEPQQIIEDIKKYSNTFLWKGTMGI